MAAIPARTARPGLRAFPGSPAEASHRRNACPSPLGTGYRLPAACILVAATVRGFADWDFRISFWEIAFPAAMPYLVRSQVLTGYATLARAFGLAPELLAGAVGLDLSALADLDARISAKAFAELLERSAEAANAEDFGLRLAESRGLGILGPVGIVMREEADLR